MQKLTAKKRGKPFDLKLLYINTRKNAKEVIERMTVNYSSHKFKGNKISIQSLYGYTGATFKVKTEVAKTYISKAADFLTFW